MHRTRWAFCTVSAQRFIYTPVVTTQSSAHMSIVSGSLEKSLHCLDGSVTGGSGGKGVHRGRPVSISDGKTAGRSGRSGDRDPTWMVLPNADVIEDVCLEELRPDDSDSCECCSESTCCGCPTLRGLCSGRYSRWGLVLAARMRIESCARICAAAQQQQRLTGLTSTMRLWKS